MARVFTDAGAMKLISAVQRMTSDVSFSVSFWIFRTATPAAQRTIITAGDTVAAVGWYVRLTTGNLVQAAFPYSTTDKIRTSSTATTLNGWMHVLVTHNNTGLNSTDFTFYLNGKGEAGTSVSNGVGTHDTATAAPIEVGTSVADGTTAPPASIGPIAIWNRALSPAEALALAGGMHPSRFSEGLIELFGMESGSFEEGPLAKLLLLPGATNPTAATANPAVEAYPNPRRKVDRGRARVANATGFTPKQRRTLHQFGTHAGGRTSRAA